MFTVTLSYASLRTFLLKTQILGETMTIGPDNLQPLIRLCLKYDGSSSTVLLSEFEDESSTSSNL